MDCGSGGPQPRDGLYDKKAGAENQTLSPGLDFHLELGGSIEWVSSQLMSMKHAHQQTPFGMSDLNTSSPLYNTRDALHQLGESLRFVPGLVSALVTRFLHLVTARLSCSWSWNDISFL
jgi:hypothetical protein